MKQHTNTPVPLGKMWTPYRTKSGFINKLMILKSRRVTGDQYFLIECSYKKKSLFNGENTSENAWLVNIYDSINFIIAASASKKLVSTSNLITDDSPQNYFFFKSSKASKGIHSRIISHTLLSFLFYIWLRLTTSEFILKIYKYT